MVYLRCSKYTISAFLFAIKRKRYHKLTAAVYAVFNGDVTAVDIDYLFDKGQSKSVALSLVGAIPLEKLIEDMLLHFLVDAAASVGYGKYSFPLATSKPYFYLTTLGGKLYRIVYKVIPNVTK